MPSSSSSSSSPLSSRAIAAAAAASLAAGAALSHLSPSSSPFLFASAKLADRGRVDSARKQQQRQQQRKAKASSSRRIKKNSNLIEEGGAAAYRGNRGGDDEKILEGEARRLQHDEASLQYSKETTDNEGDVGNDAAGSIRGAGEQRQRSDVTMLHPFDDSPDTDTGGRHLSSQLTGCCTQYISYDAMQMCSLYGEDCESGEQPSHDSGDDSCEQEGLSFIGVSFSVNTAKGNPLSYQLCDQFPMENIIDREYEYVMSMDEDGWLVGGGYKSFDYSGKMP